MDSAIFSKRLIVLALSSALAIAAGVGAGSYLFVRRSQPAGNVADIAAKLAPIAGRFVRVETPQEAPDLVFADGNAQTHHLAEWRGKSVVLNLWATWCAPCKTEMPALDRLQERLNGSGVAVIALSTDRTGPKAPAAFFQAQNISHLALYNDDTAEANVKMKAPGLPLTILIDRQGREIARYLGPADWDSPDVLAQIKGMIGG